MKLTQKAVDAIGLDADRVVWDDDTPGLGVRVQSGRRSWIIRYRVGGVQRQKSLPGALPLKQARTQAAEIRTGAIRGSDVIAEAKAAATDARRGAATARRRARLASWSKSYLADAEKRLRPASLRVATLYLSKHWSSLHERPADELTRREIIEVLEPYAGRVTSAQMLRHLSACLTWAIDRGLIERHAAIAIRPPVQRVTRERVLTEAEMKAVWSATEGHGDGQADVSYFPILRLLLLTGQRREEVGAMRWSELDLDRGTLATARHPHQERSSARGSAAPAGRGDLAGDTSGRPRVRVRLPDARVREVGRQQATARPEVRRHRLDGARPAPDRCHRHGRDRHRAAHRRGRRQPYQWP